MESRWEQISVAVTLYVSHLTCCGCAQCETMVGLLWTKTNFADKRQLSLPLQDAAEIL